MQLKNVAKKFVVRKNPLHKTIKKNFNLLYVKITGTIYETKSISKCKKVWRIICPGLVLSKLLNSVKDSTKIPSISFIQFICSICSTLSVFLPIFGCSFVVFEFQ